MKIRLANKTDADIISSLNNEVQRIHANALPQIFKQPSKDTYASSEFIKIIQKPDNFIFICYDSDEPVGYIFVEIINYPETSYQYSMYVLYIQHISVKQSHRGKGIGKALIQHVNNLARERKISLIMLDLWSFNINAREFFNKNGFSVFNEKMWMKVQLKN